jgi:hypothetical protein
VVAILEALVDLAVLMKTLRRLLPLLLLLPLGSCILRVRRARVEEVTTRNVTVESPIKAHLRDGGFVLYRRGATISTSTINGMGIRYNSGLDSLGAMGPLSLDSVIGIVNFRDATSTAPTVIYSTLASSFAAVGALALFKAIFGSCPTFYTEGTLEAEGFSYSIAPAFEARDVDALRHAPTSSVYRLEVRNEALETHYINQLELLSYEHAAGSTLLPDGFGRATVLRGSVTPITARDADGRDVRAAVMQEDDQFFATSEPRLAGARPDQLHDYIEVNFGTVSSDSVAVVVRARNSLLTTVLLYDVMLGDAGAHALDWLARDMSRIDAAGHVANWYTSRMGMRVEVWQDGGWRHVARLPDAGPIAWKDFAVLLPVQQGQPVRARLHFPADNWRIDHVYLGVDARRVKPTVIPLSRVVNDERITDASALRALARADDDYLITEPGRRFFAEFDLPARNGMQRSYMLASQGYYSEWIRPQWIRGAAPRRTFVAADESLLLAMQRWREDKAELEAQFYSSKIPVQR